MLKVCENDFRGKGAFFIVLCNYWFIFNSPGAPCLFYLRITCLFTSGVLDMLLPLSSQPKYGDWKIQVRGYVSSLHYTAIVRNLPTLQNRLHLHAPSIRCKVLANQRAHIYSATDQTTVLTASRLRLVPFWWNG